MNPVARRFAQIGVLILVQALALFLSVGRGNWAEAWAYLGLYLAFIALNAALILPKGTALIAERGRTEIPYGWDRVVGVFIAVCGPAVLIVAGLDERLGWPPSPGFGIRAGAFVVMALGDGLFAWAMSTNQFFSAVVRIQTERGHTVVSGGPYQFVRHPGYVGMCLTSLATPLMLGSLWALIPAAVLVGAMVFRTAREDATLQNELAGYVDYGRRVKYRLLPGIW